MPEAAGLYVKVHTSVAARRHNLIDVYVLYPGCSLCTSVCALNWTIYSFIRKDYLLCSIIPVIHLQSLDVADTSARRTRWCLQCEALLEAGS